MFNTFVNVRLICTTSPDISHFKIHPVTAAQIPWG